jgi:hypothetical protein
LVAGAPGRRSPLPLETHATVSLLVCPAWNWDTPLRNRQRVRIHPGSRRRAQSRWVS